MVTWDDMVDVHIFALYILPDPVHVEDVSVGILIPLLCISHTLILYFIL